MTVQIKQPSIILFRVRQRERRRDKRGRRIASCQIHQIPLRRPITYQFIKSRMALIVSGY